MPLTSIFLNWKAWILYQLEAWIPHDMTKPGPFWHIMQSTLMKESDLFDNPCAATLNAGVRSVFRCSTALLFRLYGMLDPWHDRYSLVAALGSCVLLVLCEKKRYFPWPYRKFSGLSYGELGLQSITVFKLMSDPWNLFSFRSPPLLPRCWIVQYMCQHYRLSYVYFVFVMNSTMIR